MSRYLYGASVQGIQEFIFATNKLQEIVGASEIVKSVADEFEKISGYTKSSENILLNAAGNIKAIFDNYEECQKVVLDFEKIIMQKAYGITISQAVVKIEDSYTQKDINELEKRLKTQRNRPSIALDGSINIVALAPSTAKPTVKYVKIQQKETAIDKATKQKRDAYDKWLNSDEKIRNKEFKNISDFSNSKNKIAVIHADGNGLGQLIPKLGNKLSKFSKSLDNATKKAFDDARDDIMDIREVVLGGDDMTVICNANNALEFTKRFLENFEKETANIKELKEIKVDKLTACAGIAYTNEKYPFHYAVNLAEALCSATKKHAKNLNPELAPSSLMFHKIQSSNFQTWDKFIKDELTIQNDEQTIRCDFGPYYLNEPNQPHICKLQNSIEAYRCDGSPISRLRNWMSELYKSDEYAKSLLERINEVTNQSGKWKCEIMDRNLENLYSGLSNDNLIIKKDDENKTPIYDILQILSTTDYKGATK
jgi:CRISPR/Cas system-associated protein Cas10 (large subunit of type III CRISPR-Cas system)